MSMDISRLAIEVTSTGIREASTALQGRNGAGGLVGAADKAEKRVTALTASLSKLTSVNSSATFAAMNAALGNMSTTMQAVVAQAKALGDALEKATGSQKNFHFHTENVTGALHRKVRVSQVALNTIKAMTTAAIAYAGVGFAQSIIKESDAWANLSARLTTATGSANNGRKALEDMYDVSQRLRVPVEANARLFARMAPAMQKMGKTGEETTKVVEGIATALQLNGATGGEAASVMLQLSQSFGSGVLNGAEFNAVAENGSKIMEALSTYTGKTKGELKKMGAEGKLSVQTMNEAILAALPQWQKEFDAMPVTVDGAMQRVKNAWTKAIGEMGKDVGLNVELAKALKIIEDMMPAVAQGLAGAFVDVVKWVETNKTMLGEIWEQIKGIGKTVWEAAGHMATLGTNTATVGGEINLVAIALKGVRYTFAAIEDILRGIKTAVALVAAALAGLVALGTNFVTRILGGILNGFADIMDMVAKGMEAVGDHISADGFTNYAKGAREAAKDALAFGDKTTEVMVSLLNVAGNWKDEMVAGKFAVRDLWNEEERLTAEKASQKEMEQEMARLRKKGSGYDSNWKLGKPTTPEPKESAAEKAQKAFEKSLADAQAMTKAQAELNRRMDEYGASFDKMTPSQKEVIRLREQLMLLEKSGKNVTEIANTKVMLAEKERTARLELLGARMKEVLQENQDGLDKEATSLKSLNAELVNAQAKLDNFGKAPGNERQGAVDALAKEIEALQQIPDLLAAQANPAFIAAKKERLEVMKQLLAVESEIGQKEVLAELDKMLDPSKAKNFGEALAGSLGEASKAAGAVGKAIQNYNARLAVTDKLKEKLSKVGDNEVKKAQYLGEIQKREAIDQMASYADMASAAKTFFKEKTAGYRMLEGVEKTYRAFQMALQVKSFLQDIGFLQASTAATVTANNTKAASDVSASTTAVNAAMIEGQAKAASGVANQAGGDPYTAWFRMAAMAAVMAGLGFAVSGGSGSASTSASRQAKAGTGTVFGDSSAKSESISKGIEILADNSDIALEHSSGMLRSLLNIEASLTGATNAILRNSGSITGRGVGTTYGRNSLSPFSSVFAGDFLGNKLGIGGLMDKLFGFGSKSELKDSGITAGNQNVGSILSSGFKGNTYQDVETTKKALFIAYSKSTSRALGELDAAIATEFTNVIKSMVDGISLAAEGLGKDSNTVRAALEAVSVSFGDLSFKGLSAEEIQKQLEAIFSGIGDTLAKTAFGDMLDAFQQAGEGLMETAIRVANGIDVASYELDKLGLTAINFADIINKSGDVAAEIVRQSIVLVETGTGIGSIVDTLSGSASEIAKTYSDLLTARNALQGLGIASDVSVALIRAAGGLDSLLDALQSYSERYFTDQERQAMETSRLQKEFAKLGQTMPATKAGFRTMIETLSASGATGQEAAMKLLLLNEAFADLMDNADALKQEAIDTARNNLSDAYEREADALRTTKERFEEFAKSLTEFRFSLLLGDQSTLTNAEKYATAKARYEATAAAALAGDQTAQDNFQSVAQEFLSFSRIMNASGSAYQSDFTNVLAQTTALEEMAKGQATMAEKQLAALDAQVAGLLTVNESVLTVAEAIVALTALLEPSSALGERANTSPVDGRVNATSADSGYVMDYSQYGAANTQALVAEIQMLRTEVSSLRSEQAAQTSALIASNYDANAQNANAVVDGTKDAAQQAVYNSKATVALV